MTMQTYTFAAAVSAYIAELPARRHNLSADRDARFIERYLLDPAANPFSEKPIADVTDREIFRFLVSLRGRPALARKCTQKIGAFFAWAMRPDRRQEFGLRSNPALHILPRHIAGPIRARYRFLDVHELHAYLAAAATLKPYQQAFAEGLALTGHRPSELGRMKWSELHLDRKVWAQPRGNAYIARVVLPDAFASKLADMRRGLPADAGDFVFSATHGRTPLLHLGRMKATLSRKMRSILGHASAPPACEWRWLDLRRTVICMAELGGPHWKNTLCGLGDSAPEDPGRRRRMSFNEAAIREALDRHADNLDSIKQQDISNHESNDHRPA